jgi:membrane-associated protein
MNFIFSFIDFILHLDQYLNTIIDQLGLVSYLVFWLVIFVETGLVVAPFLPGDSLLFGLGVMSGAGQLNIIWLTLGLSLAAILGDSLNYMIGRFLGEKILAKNYKFINKNHLAKTQKFYEQHGNKTIVLARFVPIVRTIAPFLAGLGKMNYRHFITYNIIGGVLWVNLFLFAGYFLGSLPWVKNNFSLIIIIIIIAFALPLFFSRSEKKSENITIINE